MKIRCWKCRYATAKWRVKDAYYCDRCVKNVKAKGPEIERLPPPRPRQKKIRYPLNALSTIA